jgi:hypothetical protein
MRPRQFAPSLDPLETRLALSTLSTPAYLGAKAAVSQALANLARTGNLQRANAALTHIAARIPLSGDLVLPLWKAELATVSRHTPGSALHARRDMFLELDTHLHRGIEAGAIAVKGPASRLVSRPAVQALDGYTAFSNDSSITLGLTVTQRGSDRVLIQQQVTSGATLYFKPPAEAFPIPPGGYTVSISTGGGTTPHGINLAELANKHIVARNGQVPGEIEVQVFQESF